MPGNVSVIVPVFNSRGTLLRTIQSIVAQLGVSTEIIVVDDGSTDGSLETLEPLAHLLHCLQQPNSGVAAARNLGMASAKGEYVAFLDSDDYWLDGFLDKTVAFLDGHRDCGAVSTAFYAYDGRSSVLVPAPSEPGPSVTPSGAVGDFFGDYARLRHIWTGAALMRRAVCEAAGPMRTDLAVAEDIEYWFRLATHTKWGFIPDPLAVYDRSSPGSLTAVSVRRGLLPDIEVWQRDIVPRLRPGDRQGFARFRSYMARTMTLNLLAQGRPGDARSVVRTGFLDSKDLTGRVLRVLRPAPAAVWWALGRLTVAVLAFKRLWRGLLPGEKQRAEENASPGPPDVPGGLPL